MRALFTNGTLHTQDGPLENVSTVTLESGKGGKPESNQFLVTGTQGEGMYKARTTVHITTID